MAKLIFSPLYLYKNKLIKNILEIINLKNNERRKKTKILSKKISGTLKHKIKNARIKLKL